MYVHLEPDCQFAIEFRDRYLPGSDILSAPRIKNMMRGHSYANVLDTVAERGGSIQLAWLLREWPGRFVEGLHYALWRDPDGNLFDVTDTAHESMTNGVSTVVLDTTTPNPTDQIGLNIPSKFIKKDDRLTTKRYISALDDFTKARDALSKACRKMGLRAVRKSDGSVVVPPPQPPIPDDLARLYDLIGRAHKKLETAEKSLL